ncbi:sigma-70 family RNA polymerase sigma factor [Bacillus sp. EB01]|uniref:sigma-70 family RNA polymerase sigma factor n=1 Tax=Bacillus sp. EB01 TaxID=1347086 RepID=UPI0005C4689F|nr:sigma-70 family RNA polymerase sigma factor [Bacillus sp. EB01]
MKIYNDLSAFTNRVNFSYKKTDKEYYEPIRTYLGQIRMIKRECSSNRLNYYEEVELFKRIEKGDKEAKEEIFYRFFTFVPRIIRYYVDNGIPIEDLVQEGNIALLEAIETFDYRFGYRFSSYAKWKIKRKVWRSIPFYLTSFDIPTNSVSVLRKINNFVDQKLSEEVYDLSILVENRIISRNELYLLFAIYPSSLNCFPQGEVECFEDRTTMPFEEMIINEQLIIKIGNIMRENLKDREENVIRLFYGLDDGRARTNLQVGMVFGISQEYVRKIKHTAIKKITKLLSKDFPE